MKELKRGAVIRHKNKNYYVKSFIREGNIVHVECEEEFQNENWKSVWLKLECIFPESH